MDVEYRVSRIGDGFGNTGYAVMLRLPGHLEYAIAENKSHAEACLQAANKLMAIVSHLHHDVLLHTEAPHAN